MLLFCQVPLFTIRKRCSTTLRIFYPQPFYPQISTDYLISKDIVIITDFNFSIFQSFNFSIFNLQSLWLLICANLCQSVVYPPPLWSKKTCAAAPSAHKQSQLCCVKQSQFYCVDNHEQPRRGVRLFASTEQPVYRLSPSLLRRGKS